MTPEEKVEDTANMQMEKAEEEERAQGARRKRANQG